MPQTLLALLALALSSFITFNQQRLTLRSHHNLVTDEIELAAAGLASEVVAFIGGRSFDENSTPSAIGANSGHIPDHPSQFTDASAAGATDRGDADCNLLKPALTPDCDDVDDLSFSSDMDGNEWRPVTVELAHGRSLPFEVRTVVYYVDNPDEMSAASGPTWHKRVLIDIRSPYAGTSEGIYRATRVVSYDPIKAEMDYENSDYYDPYYGHGEEIEISLPETPTP